MPASVAALRDQSTVPSVAWRAFRNAPGGYTYTRVSRDEVQPKRPSDGVLSGQQLAREYIDAPLLPVLGAADGFLGTVMKTRSILAEMEKDSAIDIDPGERHGFYFGPGKTNGKFVPAPAFSKALEKAVEFLQDKTR